MNHLRTLYIVIIILVLALSYTWKKKVKTIDIPSQVGSFTSSNPEPITLYETVEVKGETEYIKVPNPINKELLDKYNQAKDSIDKLKLFKEVITERKYVEVFEDSVQKITVETNVIGTLLNQRVDYKTKAKKIEIKSSKRLEFYLGVNTLIPIETPTVNGLTPLAIGIDVKVLTNNKVFSLGINSNKTIMAGMSFKI